MTFIKPKISLLKKSFDPRKKKKILLKNVKKKKKFGHA